eukprot:6476182-Amphidinium_carterae.1
MEARVQELEGRLQAMAELNVRMEGALAEQRQQLVQQQQQQRATATSAHSAIDTRLLGRPKTFSGKDEDWSQWAVVMRAYA